MEKKLNVNVCGREITLDLGVNMFYEIFEQQTGIDLFAGYLIDIGTIKILRYVKGFLIAGYRTACFKAGRQPELTDQQIIDYVMGIDPDEATDIFMRCTASRAGCTVDELKKKVSDAVKESLEQSSVSSVGRKSSRKPSGK